VLANVSVGECWFAKFSFGVVIRTPGKAFIVESRVIAAAPEAIVTEDQLDHHLRKVSFADSLDVPRDLSRSESFGSSDMTITRRLSITPLPLTSLR